MENNIEPDRPQRALRGGLFRRHTQSYYVIFKTFPRQYCLLERTTILRYTDGASSFPCWVTLHKFPFFSIAVHIRSVFCVPCTFCDNVQQCVDAAILSGKCSAVWDALSLQYTCTEGSVSVHMHQQASHTHVYVDVPCACVAHMYPFCTSLQRDMCSKWTTTNYWDKPKWEHSHLPSLEMTGDFLWLKSLAPKVGCVRAILIAATTIAEIKIADH